MTATQPFGTAGLHTLSLLLGYLRRFLYCFVPQFFRTRYFDDSLPRGKYLSTSWINGLRGCAALLVCLFHNILGIYEVRRYPQDPDVPGAWPQWLWLPFVHLPLSGHSMIGIFFVAGGYVLSLKPLQMMEAGGGEMSGKIMNVLSSSVFRRWFRIYLLATTVSFLDAVFVHGHFWFWFYEIRRIFNLFNYESTAPGEPCDPALWTVAIEVRSSLMLFVVLVGVAHLRSLPRFVGMFLMGLYSSYYNNWAISLFLFGACSAQVQVILSSKSASQPLSCQTNVEEKEVPSSTWESLPSSLQNSFAVPLTCLTIFVAVYLMSCPEWEVETTPGYKTLSKLIPAWFIEKGRWLPAIGAIMLVNTLGMSREDSFIRKPFNSWFAQYLGSISFALYVTHGPQLRLYAWQSPKWVWSIIPSYIPFAYSIGLFFAVACNLLIFVCIADITAREIETRLTRLTIWLEKSLVENPEKPQAIALPQ